MFFPSFIFCIFSFFDVNMCKYIQRWNTANPGLRDGSENLDTWTGLCFLISLGLYDIKTEKKALCHAQEEQLVESMPYFSLL